MKLHSALTGFVLGNFSTPLGTWKKKSQTNFRRLCLEHRPAPKDVPSPIAPQPLSQANALHVFLHEIDNLNEESESLIWSSTPRRPGSTYPLCSLTSRSTSPPQPNASEAFFHELDNLDEDIEPWTWNSTPLEPME